MRGGKISFSLPQFVLPKQITQMYRVNRAKCKHLLTVAYPDCLSLPHVYLKIYKHTAQNGEADLFGQDVSFQTAN